MARSSYNEFHLPILLKLQPLFKVAEYRAVCDVPPVDPATGQWSGHRLALRGGVSVVHVTESRYEDRDYVWVATEAGDNGLRAGLVQGRDGPMLKITDITANSAAAQHAEAEERDFVRGEYCHPRKPYLHSGLIVEKINGRTVDSIWEQAAQVLQNPEFVDVELAQLALHGYDPEEALKSLRHVSPFHGQMDSGSDGMTTKVLTCMGYMEEARVFPKADVRVEFTEPAATMMNGWMEGPDADECLQTMRFQAETFFEATVAGSDEQGNTGDFRVRYVCGKALGAACQQMRLKDDAKRPWVEDSNVRSLVEEPGFELGSESIAAIEAEAAQNALLAQPELEDGWVPVIDPTSGETYYENMELGETTWDPPYRAS